LFLIDDYKWHLFLSPLESYQDSESHTRMILCKHVGVFFSQVAYGLMVLAITVQSFYCLK